MTEDQIKHLVNRFLGWKLPADFRPDAGISYVPPSYADKLPPSGTNLFDATQADAMVRYMVKGMPLGPRDTVNAALVLATAKEALRADAQEVPGPARCEICDWPLAKTREEGCVPGDCSYRTDNPAEQQRLCERREQVAARTSPQKVEALEEMRARKDAAYEERNKVVAALARLFPSGVARTAIPGWSDDWHGCVYIDLPTGQVSWHYHDSQAHLFAELPAYTRGWDGHDTAEKYRRLGLLHSQEVSEKGGV